MEDLHAALGYGKFSARQVLQKLAPDQVLAEAAGAGRKPQPPQLALPERPARLATGRRPGDLVIKVKGVDDLLVYRAKCCNPIRGEAIVGYVTRGKGIAVHSDQLHQRAEPDVRGGAQDRRRVGARRQRSVPGEDGDPHRRPSRHAEPAHLVLFNESSNIRSLEARADDKRNGDGAIVEMTVEIRDKKQLERVVSAIRRISGVRDVETSSVTDHANDPEHIAISKSKGIKIDWKDGHHSEYSAGLSARRMPLRHLHRARTEPSRRRSNYSAPQGRSVPDVQARYQDAERGTRRQLRHPHRLERRAQHRDLFLRSPARRSAPAMPAARPEKREKGTTHSATSPSFDRL